MYGAVYPVRHVIGGNCFTLPTSDTLADVYDQAADGTLVPVKYEQTGKAVYLPFMPHGNLFYRCKA